MMRQIGWKKTLCFSAFSTAISALGLHSDLYAAPPERPTFNHTADPRPNILPDSLYNHHEPYRLRYNRPTYHVGKALYHVVSPTSQEAMAWKENLDECRYEGHNCPPVYKTYYYPKPWEILNTGPRPNFASANAKPAPVQVTPVVPQPTPPAPSNSTPKEAEKVEAEEAKKVKADQEPKADKEAVDKATEKATEKVPAPK